MKSGNLNFLEPSGPLQACNGTALPLPLLYTGNAFLFRCSYSSPWYAWQSTNAFARASMPNPFAQCTARLYSVRWPCPRVLCLRSALSHFVLQVASLCGGLPWYRMDSQSRRAGHCRPIDCLTHWLPHTETRLNDSRRFAGESFVCWSFTFLHKHVKAKLSLGSMWRSKVAGWHRLILRRSSAWVEQLISRLHHSAPRGSLPPPPPPPLPSIV